MIKAKVLAGGLTFAAIGAASLGWVLGNRGITVVLRNTDVSTLSGVFLHVTGRDYPIGDMLSGSTRRVLVDPTGESHIEISQEQADGRGRIPVSWYFEPGYTGVIEIHLSRNSATLADNQTSVGWW